MTSLASSPTRSPAFRATARSLAARSRWRAGLVATITFMLLLGSMVVPAGAAPAPASCTDPFTLEFRSSLAQTFPNQRVTASVYDTRTGCWYHLSPGMQITTASVIKAQFLAGVLLRAQDLSRAMTDWERSRVHPMMTYSHNPPASDLFVSLGGVRGMDQLDSRFGLTATGHTSTWGLTTTTAADRTRLALAMLHGGGPMGPAARAEAWHIMSSVHPTQKWGVSAGVPSGWSVALKNGFYPASGAGWRIGSTGFVRHDNSGQGYAVSIMSDRNPDHGTGQRVVETVSRRVASVLAGTPPAARAVDGSVCAQTRGGESWTTVAHWVGTNDAAGVQRVSGGTPAPIAGMRACNPVVYQPNGPTARFVRAAYRTFVERAPSEAETRAQVIAIDSRMKSRVDLTRQLANSVEWISVTIQSLYRSALGRTADAGGLRYWRDRVVNGLRITDVGVYFYASDEFLRRSGGTDRTFVTALYDEILGRSPDTAGLDHWLGALRSGRPRTYVAASFYASSESRRDRVTSTYHAVLGRAPDPGGLGYWSGVLVTRDDVALASFLAASDEYFRRAQS